MLTASQMVLPLRKGGDVTNEYGLVLGKLAFNRNEVLTVTGPAGGIIFNFLPVVRGKFFVSDIWSIVAADGTVIAEWTNGVWSDQQGYKVAETVWGGLGAGAFVLRSLPDRRVLARSRFVRSTLIHAFFPGTSSVQFAAESSELHRPLAIGDAFRQWVDRRSE